jgi:hypothetical protein
MILYIKYLKNSTQKLLDIINSFSKVAGYKISLQKSVAFYTPTMSRLRKNIGKQFHLQQPQKNQSPRNKLNKECKWPLQGEIQTIEERHWRRLQKVEKSPMLMDWQNQYCENGHTTKSELHVQCNSHQNPSDIHHRDWKIYLKVYLET